MSQETWQEWAARTCPDADYQQLLKRLDMPTNAEKQAQFRKRQAAEGKTELRGVYVPKDKHNEVKQLIREHLAKK